MPKHNNCLQLVLFLSFSRQLAASTQAFSGSNLVGYGGSRFRPKQGGRPQGTAAVEANDIVGPEEIEWDVMRINSWALFATSGAYTATHHDAGGLATYVTCETGAKVWSYLLPKDSSSNLAEAVERYRFLADAALEVDPGTLMEHFRSECVVLTPGVMLYVVTFVFKSFS